MVVILSFYEKNIPGFNSKAVLSGVFSIHIPALFAEFCGCFVRVFFEHAGKIGNVSDAGFFHDLNMGEVRSKE